MMPFHRIYTFIYLLAEMPGVAGVDHRRMGCTPPHNFVVNCISYAGPLLTTSSLCSYG
jgi:hypothetical protein